jgi:hypothetical protein
MRFFKPNNWAIVSGLITTSVIGACLGIIVSQSGFASYSFVGVLTVLFFYIWMRSTDPCLNPNLTLFKRNIAGYVGKVGELARKKPRQKTSPFVEGELYGRLETTKDIKALLDCYFPEEREG